MVLRKGHRMYLARPVAVNETWLGGGVVEAMLRGPEGSRALRKGEAGCSTSSAVRNMSSALWSAVSMALSADGGLVASASWDGRVGLWDAASGQRLAILQGHTGMVSTVALCGRASGGQRQCGREGAALGDRNRSARRDSAGAHRSGLRRASQW